MGFLKQGIRSIWNANQGPSLVPGTHEGRVVAITTRKGGVGKTTISSNLATVLAKDFGKKVLLVDLDPQGHARASTHALHTGQGGQPLSRLLLDKRRELLEAAAPTSVEGLYVVHADPGLNEAENLLSARIGKEFILRNMLRVTRTHFDLVLLDTPPNLGNLTVAGLVAADACLLPLDLSALALRGLDDILEAMETIEERLGHVVELLGVVVNRYDRRLKTVNAPVLAELQERFGPAVLPAFLPSSSAIGKAQLAGQPLVDYAPKSAAARAFHDLAAQVLDRLAPSAHARPSSF